MSNILQQKAIICQEIDLGKHDFTVSNDCHCMLQKGEIDRPVVMMTQVLALASGIHSSSLILTGAIKIPAASCHCR